MVYNNEVTLLALHSETGKYIQSIFHHMRGRQHRNYFDPCMGFYSFLYFKEGFMVVFKNS